MIEIHRKNKPSVSSIMVQASVNNQLEMIEKRDKNTKTVRFPNVLRPIYYISRAFGFMPYSIIHDSNGDIKEPNVKKIDILWLLLSITIHSFIVVLLHNNMKSLQDPTRPYYILMIGDHLVAFVTVMFGIVMIGIDLCNRFKFIDILKKITTSDKEVMRNEHLTRFNHHFKCVFPLIADDKLWK